MKLHFDLIKYFTNAVQERVKSVSSCVHTVPVEIESFVPNTTLLVADEFMRVKGGTTYIPSMAIRIDTYHPMPIILINNAWVWGVPRWVSLILVHHELGHLTPGALALEPCSLEQELYCDRYADSVTDGKLHLAFLWFNEHYPGVIQQERIEASLPKGTRKSLSWRIAKVLI